MVQCAGCADCVGVLVKGEDILLHSVVDRVPQAIVLVR